MNFTTPYRILLGPLYTGSLLGRWQQHPDLLTFGTTGALTLSEHHPFRPLLADLHYEQNGDFAQVLAALPPGWEPDLVIWTHLALHGVPADLADCPWPTLAIAQDAHLDLPTLLDYAQAFDYVVADRGLTTLLQRQGFDRVAYWPCYGHDPTRHYLLPGLERPWDVVFAGNLSYHFHGPRNRWIQRLSRLNERYRVLITDRSYGDDYLRLLNQAKLVFNYSLRGEMNLRAYEAAACGAVLLCERDNREIRDFLVDGESCLLYGDDDFETVIAGILADDARRRRIAAAGVTAIGRHDCEQAFARLLERVPEVQAAFARGVRRRFQAVPAIWRQWLSAKQFAASRTPRPLPPLNPDPLPEAAELAESDREQLRAGLALLHLQRSWNAEALLQGQPAPAGTAEAVASLAQAVARLPQPLWPAYALACGYTLLRRPQAALTLWERILPQLQTLEAQSAPLRAEQLSILPPQADWQCFFDATLGAALQLQLARVLIGEASSASLYRLLRRQALELAGYALMQLQRPQQAIAIWLQAEALPPASFFTYAPLLPLLQRAGREAELAAGLARASEQLGLTEAFVRDRALNLARQGDSPALRQALQDYRLLLSRCHGGGPQARGSLQETVPELLLWIPELLEQAHS